MPATAPEECGSHPEKEHFIPLLIAAGAGGDAPGRELFEDEMIGSVPSAFSFSG